jgi:hypothetical protein
MAYAKKYPQQTLGITEYIRSSPGEYGEANYRHYQGKDLHDHLLRCVQA